MKLVEMTFLENSKIKYEVDLINQSWIVVRSSSGDSFVTQENVCSINTTGKIAWSRDYHKPSDDIKQAVKEIVEHLKKSGLI